MWFNSLRSSCLQLHYSSTNTVSPYQFVSSVWCSIRRILERGRGRKFRKLENYKDQNENFSTQNQSGFSVQNPMKSKKKGLHSNYHLPEALLGMVTKDGSTVVRYVLNLRTTYLAA